LNPRARQQQACKPDARSLPRTKEYWAGAQRPYGK